MSARRAGAAQRRDEVYHSQLTAAISPRLSPGERNRRRVLFRLEDESEPFGGAPIQPSLPLRGVVSRASLGRGVLAGQLLQR